MKHIVCVCVLIVSGAVLIGCGDDSGAQAGQDGGRDASDVTQGNDSAIPYEDAAMSTQDASLGKDAGGTQDDAGSEDDGGTVAPGEMFKVPKNGGSYMFKTTSGKMVGFKFPKSAKGVEVTLESVDPGKVTWGNDNFGDAFVDAIRLGPDGMKFADPIEVVLPGKHLMAFTFSDEGGVPNPLPLAAGKAALELHHFSTLAIVAPGQSCESLQGGPLSTGWSDYDNAQQCSSFTGKTTYRSYGCKNYVFCYTITAGCCVAPGGTSGDDCKVDDTNASLNFSRANNGGQYPYCEGEGDTPYVQSIAPTALIANSNDQVITLTGFGFTSDGSVMVNGDEPVTTTFVSSTEVHATVTGSHLQSQGTLQNIGFVTKLPAGGYNFPYRSNYVNLPINNPPVL